MALGCASRRESWLMDRSRRVCRRRQRVPVQGDHRPARQDTLCGTKALRRADYLEIAAARSYFGDFDLLFGAARLSLKVVDVPVRYQSRTYGTTSISRWRHGLLLPSRERQPR